MSRPVVVRCLAVLTVSLLVAAACGTSDPTPIVAPQAPTPRVILTIMLDDADYHDVGFNSDDAVTPNLDRLRAQGMALTSFTSASAICSPTRISVMTGTSPVRYGALRLWPDSTSPNQVEAPEEFTSSLRGLPDDIPLLPGLSEAGYATLHVGKWHIGDSEVRYTPRGLGFEDSAVLRRSPDAGRLPYRAHSGRWLSTAEEYPSRSAFEVDRIIGHLDDNLDVREGVYANWWPLEPHAPFRVPPSFTPDEAERTGIDTTTNRGAVLAMMYEWDQELGRLIEYLEERELFDETLILVTSDNGGNRQALAENRDVTGPKGVLHEGGIRVPFVATWPGRIEAGSARAEPASTMDILPTVFDAAGLGVPDGLDGISLLPLLRGGAIDRVDPILYAVRVKSWRSDSAGAAEADDPTYADRVYDSFAMRDGCFKMIRHAATNNGTVPEHEYALYDLCADPLEADPITAGEQFEEFRTRLLALRADTARLDFPESSSEPIDIPYDPRLDTHHDDLSFYATVPGFSRFDQRVELFRRGRSIRLFIDGDNRLRMVARGTIVPSRVAERIGRLDLEAELPTDGSDLTIGLVIHNYLSSGATFELWVNGELGAQLTADFGTNADINDPTLLNGSLFALLGDGTTGATLGDDGLDLADVAFYALALRPFELPQE